MFEMAVLVVYPSRFEKNRVKLTICLVSPTMTYGDIVRYENAQF